ncbi:MAG: PstS family phosphate ABC transporter substrate-binding protein [Bacteroidota bacterium]|nr:PstS family phosphate ABC transporter substrate-binding protein [Bacteroidota bacterium]
MKIKNKYYWIILGWILFLVSIHGCLKERRETPTKGNITIAVSESVFPMMEQEEQKFEQIYRDAKLELLPMTTREAITRLFNDTIKLIVASRPLNAEEQAAAKQFNIEIKEYKIAIDGVGFLVNVQNPVKELRTTQLDSIYRGTIKNWSQVGGRKTPIDIYLPNPNSANYEIVGLKVLKGEKYTVPSNVTKSSEEMLQYVSEQPNAIGMVGLNWLNQKKENITVLKLSDPDAPDSLGIRGQYFAPFQAHVYRGYYPITRNVYIYSRVDMYSVGAGFIAFVTSAPGQQVVLNNGLVPATMPIRLVELSNKGIQ